jgi:hypothetical protein
LKDGSLYLTATSLVVENSVDCRPLRDSVEIFVDQIGFHSISLYHQYCSGIIDLLTLMTSQIPVICLRNDPLAEAAPMWRQQILSALAVISDMSKLNSAASRCHTTIFNLVGGWLGDNTPPNLTESPQTQLNALHSFLWPITDPNIVGGYDGFQESAAYDFMTNLGNF